MILDAKYVNSDLNMVMDEKCQHLSAEERYRLLTVLRKFEDILDDTLCMSNTTPLDL